MDGNVSRSNADDGEKPEQGKGFLNNGQNKCLVFQGCLE